MSAKDLVISFLTALEARELDKAQSFFAPGAKMTFPSGKVLATIQELVEWSKGRYKFVRKSLHQFDEETHNGVTTVYCRGVLNGEWLDGSPIKDVRFIDRFEFKDGKIIDQQVWNDLAEFR